MEVVISPDPQEEQAASDQEALYLPKGQLAQAEPLKYFPGSHLQSTAASWPRSPLVVRPPAQGEQEVATDQPPLYLLCGPGEGEVVGKAKRERDILIEE